MVSTSRGEDGGMEEGKMTDPQPVPATDQDERQLAELGYRQELDDPEKAARRLVHLPMGRFAEAREIAHGALFLASDESSYVTASTFLVDGGLSGAYVTPE
jgi:NAD(P)-dependent dehydrogenase (short-subunit alcohol dehydrogenase family)